MLLAITALPAHGLGSWGGGFALESVVARVCREAGGRVSTNVLLRDLDPEAGDRVQKLQQALDILGDTEGPEVDGLRSIEARRDNSPGCPSTSR